MFWKNQPYWLRGGLIGVLFFVILFGVKALITLNAPVFSPPTSPFLNTSFFFVSRFITNIFPSLLYDLILTVVFNLLVYFLIGMTTSMLLDFLRHKNAPYWLKGSFLFGFIGIIFSLLAYNCTTTAVGFFGAAACVLFLPFVSATTYFLNIFFQPPYLSSHPFLFLVFSGFASSFPIGAAFGLVFGPLIKLIKEKTEKTEKPKENYQPQSGLRQKKYLRPFLVLAAIVILIWVGLIIYRGISTKLVPPEPRTLLETQTAGWQTYRNEQYGFELKYPDNFKATVDVNPAGYLNLYIGFNNTPYLGDISMQAFSNKANDNSIQYFLKQKNQALQGFASKCSTCANMDIEAEEFDCLANKAETIKIGGEDGFFCPDMPSRSTRPSLVYVFNGGFIYRFFGYAPDNPVYETYKKIVSTFRFIK